MIAFLEGVLVTAGCDAVISVGGGLGLDVQLSALSAERLPAPGETVRLWTHLAVREDHWALYGFVREEERAMFRLLISVAGIGPKVALGMLSKVAPAELAGYLRTGDEVALARLPGIGKKSAARLVVELGQRVPALAGAVPDAPADADAGGLADAVAVLAAMGLTPQRAEQALLRARAGEPRLADDLEAWVKAALRAM